MQRPPGLASLFPTERQIPSLRLPVEPRTIERDKLDVYLGTRYPRYGRYNVQEVLSASYFPVSESQPTGVPAVDMEVIRLASTDDAFGLFSIERPEITGETRIEDHGYITDTEAGFWSGELYIRILTPKETESHTRWLRSVAEVVIRRLPHGPGTPPGFERLPQTLRVPHSEVFVRQDALGYKFLTDTYFADYDFGGGIATAFVCPCSAEDIARERFRALFEAVLRQNAQAAPLSGLGERAFLARRSRHGNIAVFQRGRFLAGLLNAPPVIGDFLDDFDEILEDSE